jgi:hypothetical protein
LQIKAYAILRTHDKDYIIKNKEVVLGRVSSDDVQEIMTEDIICLSKSKRVSRRAAKITLNDSGE